MMGDISNLLKDEKEMKKPVYSFLEEILERLDDLHQYQEAVRLRVAAKEVVERSKQQPRECDFPRDSGKIISTVIGPWTRISKQPTKEEIEFQDRFNVEMKLKQTMKTNRQQGLLVAVISLPYKSDLFDLIKNRRGLTDARFRPSFKPPESLCLLGEVPLLSRLVTDHVLESLPQALRALHLDKYIPQGTDWSDSLATCRSSFNTIFQNQFDIYASKIMKNLESNNIEETIHFLKLLKELHSAYFACCFQPSEDFKNLPSRAAENIATFCDRVFQTTTCWIEAICADTENLVLTPQQSTDIPRQLGLLYSHSTRLAPHCEIGPLKHYEICQKSFLSALTSKVQKIELPRCSPQTLHDCLTQIHLTELALKENLPAEQFNFVDIRKLFVEEAENRLCNYQEAIEQEISLILYSFGLPGDETQRQGVCPVKGFCDSYTKFIEVTNSPIKGCIRKDLYHEVTHKVNSSVMEFFDFLSKEIALPKGRKKVVFSEHIHLNNTYYLLLQEIDQVKFPESEMKTRIFSMKRELLASVHRLIDQKATKFKAELKALLELQPKAFPKNQIIKLNAAKQDCCVEIIKSEIDAKIEGLRKLVEKRITSLIQDVHFLQADLLDAWDYEKVRLIGSILKTLEKLVNLNDNQSQDTLSKLKRTTYEAIVNGRFQVPNKSKWDVLQCELAWNSLFGEPRLNEIFLDLKTQQDTWEVELAKTFQDCDWNQTNIVLDQIYSYKMVFISPGKEKDKLFSWYPHCFDFWVRTKMKIQTEAALFIRMVDLLPTFPERAASMGHLKDFLFLRLTEDINFNLARSILQRIEAECIEMRSSWQVKRYFDEDPESLIKYILQPFKNVMELKKHYDDICWKVKTLLNDQYQKLRKEIPTLSEPDVDDFVVQEFIILWQKFYAAECLDNSIPKFQGPVKRADLESYLARSLRGVTTQQSCFLKQALKLTLSRSNNEIN